MKKRKWWYWAAVCCLAAAAGFFCGCERMEGELLIAEKSQESLCPLTDEEHSSLVESRMEIVVHICGQVKSPGLYRVPAGSRYGDLLGLCGGVTPEADPDSLNLAREAADGERIYVPAKGETVARSAETEDGKIDLNTADAELLMSLPGIGKTKAEAILSYREEHGAFASIEELKQVSGIKDALFSRVKQYIYVSGAP